VNAIGKVKFTDIRGLATQVDFWHNKVEAQMTTITLPPEIEAPLADAARKKGTTPQLLAVETLRQRFPPSETPVGPDESQTLYDFLAGDIGVVEGFGEALSENCGERFTDWLVEKHKAGRL
jgi:hypothetical protein